MQKIINILSDLASHTHRISIPGVSLDLTRLPVTPTGPELFTQDQVDLLEAKYQTKLPDDYRKLVTEFGVFNLGFEYNDEADEFMMLGFEGMYHDMYSPITGTPNSGLKRVFPFAVDMGGRQYFYDLDNLTGHGQCSVFMVDPGTPQWKYCYYAGSSLTEILHCYLNGHELNGHYL